jgi:hypothetical protein
MCTNEAAQSGVEHLLGIGTALGWAERNMQKAARAPVVVERQWREERWSVWVDGPS